jgi:catechol 2,3-dioxygenase-like lactoylglutathione lyase family enzyme
VKLDGIDHIALTVADVPRSVGWYQATLGLERRYEAAWGDYPAVVCAGETCLALFPAGAEPPSAPPAGAGAGMRHLAFRVDRANFAAAQQHLSRQGIRWHLEDHGIAYSIYFQDPDGHRLEITTYDLGPDAG